MCWYSGLVAKYSRSLRRAAIISTLLFISAWERLTTPIQGNCSLYALPSRICTQKKQKYYHIKLEHSNIPRKEGNLSTQRLLIWVTCNNLFIEYSCSSKTHRKRTWPSSKSEKKKYGAMVIPKQKREGNAEKLPLKIRSPTNKHF